MKLEGLPGAISGNNPHRNPSGFSEGIIQSRSKRTVVCKGFHV